MKTITINISKSKSICNVFIGSALLKSLPSLYDFSKHSSICVISDSNVGPQYVQSIKRLRIHKKLFCFTFQAGEQHKNLETVSQSYRFLAQHQVDRKGLIINLGGGVVTDLGGFVAATYLRGIDSINIPTTIEGMVDASIGGKVGVNLNHWKNYIGAFHQPQSIVMDIDTLSTLSRRNLIAGFGEIIKHGLISDKAYFDFATSKKPEEFTPEEMIKIIGGSCMIKKKIVEKDETENGSRKLLNFGHTAGHAIESACLQKSNPLLHGEAVGIGMIVASRISNQLKLISDSDFLEIRSAINTAGLPTTIPQSIILSDIMDLMAKDKKNIGGKTSWVLLDTVGKAILRNDVQKNVILDSINYVLNSSL